MLQGRDADKAERRFSTRATARLVGIGGAMAGQRRFCPTTDSFGTGGRAGANSGFEESIFWWFSGDDILSDRPEVQRCICRREISQTMMKKMFIPCLQSQRDQIYQILVACASLAGIRRMSSLSSSSVARQHRRAKRKRFAPPLAVSCIWTSNFDIRGTLWWRSVT